MFFRNSIGSAEIFKIQSLFVILRRNMFVLLPATHEKGENNIRDQTNNERNGKYYRKR